LHSIRQRSAEFACEQSCSGAHLEFHDATAHLHAMVCAGIPANRALKNCDTVLEIVGAASLARKQPFLRAAPLVAAATMTPRSHYPSQITRVVVQF
jgi:hypothetical protein